MARSKQFQFYREEKSNAAMKIEGDSIRPRALEYHISGTSGHTGTYALGTRNV